MPEYSNWDAVPAGATVYCVPWAFRRNDEKLVLNKEFSFSTRKFGTMSVEVEKEKKGTAAIAIRIMIADVPKGDIPDSWKVLHWNLKDKPQFANAVSSSRKSSEMFEDYIQQYIRTGTIADKELFLDMVTLDFPEKWGEDWGRHAPPAKKPGVFLGSNNLLEKVGLSVCYFMILAGALGLPVLIMSVIFTAIGML